MYLINKRHDSFKNEDAESVKEIFIVSFWSNSCGELLKHLHMLLLSWLWSTESNISIVIPVNVSIGMS